VSDDTVGGDTEEDGAATAPVPGSWGSLTINSSGSASSVEHLLARYGGASIAAVQIYSPLATARSVRCEHSASDGFRVSNHAGSAVNWVAFDCAGNGLDLTGGAFDVVHATVTGCGGFGVRSATGHVGAVRNANVFGNAGGELSGFVPGEVFSSNAGAPFAGFDGNIAADPQFVDALAGDLRLGLGSPCVEAGDVVTGLGAIEDHREASRLLDDEFDGSLSPDMGAYERAAYTLQVGGEPRQATVMSFAAAGAEPGIALFQLGVLDGVLFFPPYGFSLAGDLSPSIFLGAAPTGSPVFVGIPVGPIYPGFEFGVQAVVLPLAFPGFGQVTEVYRGTIYP
jgi:hypothetical protein